MKNVKLLVTIVVFLVLTATVSYSVPFFTESGFGAGDNALIVETNVPGVNVYVDGRYKCTTYEQTEKPEEKPKLIGNLTLIPKPEDMGEIPTVAGIFGAGILAVILGSLRYRFRFWNRFGRKKSSRAQPFKRYKFTRGFRGKLRDVGAKVFNSVRKTTRIFSSLFRKIIRRKKRTTVSSKLKYEKPGKRFGRSFGGIRNIISKFSRIPRTIGRHRMKIFRMRTRIRRTIRTVRNRISSGVRRFIGALRRVGRRFSSRISRRASRPRRSRILRSRFSRSRSRSRGRVRSRGRSRGRVRSRSRGRSRGGRRR